MAKKSLKTGKGEITAAFVLLFGLILFASCDTSRRGQTGVATTTPVAPSGEVREEESPVPSPSGLPVEDNITQLDSIGIEMSVNENDPFGGGNQPAGNTERLSTYNVVLLLPFLTDRFDPVDARFSSISKWSVNFYGGAKMALDELRRQDVGLQVSVFDTRGSEKTMERMLQQQALSNAHLIIGPYRRTNLQMVAEFGKRNDINVVSPYSATSNMTSENPHYIQVRPSLETHCRALMEHALRDHPATDVVLVGQDRPLERKSLEYFNEAFRMSPRARDTSGLREFLVSSSPEIYQAMNLSRLLGNRDTTVFVVSAWGNDDENFVHSFLRNLELATRPEQYVVVYGTPVWQDYDRIDMDYFEKMNVRLSSNAFVDASDPKIREFRRKFFDRYGNLPQEEAYLGFDTMLFFGEMLKKYGTRFENDLEKENMRGLHTNFAFERVVRTPETTGMENLPIQQFENKFVNILKFEDYQFRLDR